MGILGEDAEVLMEGPEEALSSFLASISTSLLLVPYPPHKVSKCENYVYLNQDRRIHVASCNKQVLSAHQEIICKFYKSLI